MSLFKRKTAYTTSVKVIENVVKPIIYISSEALYKMQVYVETCDDEIGWFASAFKVEAGKYFITDAYLFEQEVHATTTEVNEDRLSLFAEEILSQEDGMEIWNSIKVWGHSHVRMATSPSAQDNSQMEFFAGAGHDFFIRIIANKTGSFTIDLYDYTIGVAYIDLPFIEYSTGQAEQILQQIAQLQAQLESITAERESQVYVGIVEEISLKVKKKAYTTTVIPVKSNYLTPTTKPTSTHSIPQGVIDINAPTTKALTKAEIKADAKKKRKKQVSEQSTEQILSSFSALQNYLK